MKYAVNVFKDIRWYNIIVEASNEREAEDIALQKVTNGDIPYDYHSDYAEVTLSEKRLEELRGEV